MGATPAADGPSSTVDHEARTAAFTALYDAHVVEVYRYVHRRCQDHPLAEDVTHDVFVTAVRTVDDPGTITIGWLLRVARNRLIDLMRRQARYADKLRLIRGGLSDEIDLGGTWVDRVVVTEALEELSVEHRLVLTLHYLDGYTVPALAHELDRTVKSVERLVDRARRNLRRELGGRHG
ncbi:MAG: sigma-70 family RNA polymerase sigma factor [Actinomycetota bacterium]